MCIYIYMYRCPVHHHVVTKHAMSQSIPCRLAYIEYGTLKTPNPFRKEYCGLPCDFDGIYFFPAPIVGGSPRRPWKRNSWYKKKMKIIELLAIRFAMVFLDFPNPQTSQWNPCGNPACSHSNLVKTLGKQKKHGKSKSTPWQIASK